jgi:beta-phosphoglucomutase
MPMMEKVIILRRKRMDWIDSFDLFLFDFDGLLVRTEHLHFRAYQNALFARGLQLPWNMHEYGQRAYFSATALRKGIMELFPAEFDSDKTWGEFYLDKQKEFMRLVEEGHVELMPGVAQLLKELKRLQKTLCVVTHSNLQMIQKVRLQLPLLDLIPHWITREDYKAPKPASDGYNLAMERYLKLGARAIGFEDSIKGLNALIGSRAKPVLICDEDPVKKDYCKKNGAIFAPSFETLSEFMSFSS